MCENVMFMSRQSVRRNLKEAILPRCRGIKRQNMLFMSHQLVKKNLKEAILPECWGIERQNMLLCPAGC